MEQTVEASLSTETTERKKPGPTAKPKIDVAVLEARIHNHELLIARMAHQSGTAHAILKKAGLTPYEPTRNDMTKFKVV